MWREQNHKISMGEDNKRIKYEERKTDRFYNRKITKRKRGNIKEDNK